jgi:hypothetical protein
MEHTNSEGPLLKKGPEDHDDGSSVASGSCSIVSGTATGVGSSSGDKEESAKAIQEAITKRESAAVLKLRILVIFILLATAVAVCAVIFLQTWASQEEEFQTQYEGAAQKIVNSVSWFRHSRLDFQRRKLILTILLILLLFIPQFDDIVNQMGAISGLGVQYSAYSTDNDLQWPMVTMSYFQQRAGNARLLSGALFLSVSPVVMPGYVKKWGEYVNSGNNSWM